ncbi:YbhB/YbcL family Raf kinase inhibitor-like protein [Eionea flava]
MQQLKNIISTVLLSSALTHVAFADSLQLSSDDISHGEFMAKAQEFEGFGCSGDNASPHLTWSGAPAETKAFAILAYDPDAPTGSGWWHWQVVNIPAEVTAISTGAGTVDGKRMPAGSLQIENDYGSKSFGGACPPKKNGAHRYQFTIHALSKKLALPDNASAALTGYFVNANSLASSTIEALYKRD